MQNLVENVDCLPEFDGAFKDSNPTIYFHHIIDTVAATLRVEVLGTSLAYTFKHERAKALLTVSNIKSRLERKTTGFLSLVVADSPRRVVLAWAESGHGAGRVGDLLDPGPNVLANDIWTKRVIIVGKLLGMKMGRPFDGIISRAMGRDMSGVYVGGHVEVKLAVHAIFVLLKTFNISQDSNSISRKHLRKLRHARWEDGSQPAFEIYFSRKYCTSCIGLVRRLARITGISIKLIWKDRLVKFVYEKTSLDMTRRPNGLRNRLPPLLDNSQAFDANDDDDDTIITDDVTPIECVDLTSNSNTFGNIPPSLIEVINLIDNESQPPNSRSSSPTPTPTQPHPLTAQAEEDHRRAEDSYLDGLAYCVGQIDSCPHGAQAAILELACKVSARKSKRPPRPKPPMNHEAWANISKPLPATAETRPPEWMAGCGGVVGLPERASDAEPPVQGTSSSSSPSQEEAITPTDQTALSHQLRTLPTSRSIDDGETRCERGTSPSEIQQQNKEATDNICPSTTHHPIRKHFTFRTTSELRTPKTITKGELGRAAKMASISAELPVKRCCSSSPDLF